jgi:hypothetical protein
MDVRGLLPTELIDLLEAIIDCYQNPDPSLPAMRRTRETSLVVTKLQEAVHWAEHSSKISEPEN